MKQNVNKTQCTAGDRRVCVMHPPPCHRKTSSHRWNMIHKTSWCSIISMLQAYYPWITCPSIDNVHEVLFRVIHCINFGDLVGCLPPGLPGAEYMRLKSKDLSNSMCIRQIKIKYLKLSKTEANASLILQLNWKMKFQERLKASLRTGCLVVTFARMSAHGIDSQLRIMNPGLNLLPNY